MLRSNRLADSLESWVKIHIPGAGDPSSIRFHPCDRIPFWWVPGNRHAQGLTLWRNVYLRRTYWPIYRDRAAIELLFHELIHVEQFQRQPIWFPIKYLLAHLRYGYHDNPAEEEARTRASQLTSLFLSDYGAQG